MDAVELGRQEAAKLNAAVIAKGIDPWDAMAIVTAAARLSGIKEVTPLKPGSPFLGTSRARYDPQSQSILHEVNPSAFLTAFLIGHEVGHAVLGDARLPDAVSEADPARSAEAAPDGEERVADYSRKSRREVQMDLFARELIMPRHFVRAQHLAGLTAQQISERFLAPFDAAAQQLLDALLLPSVEPRDEQTDAFPLNARQAAAACHRGPAFLLEAGPGTGKTKTLVGRIADLIERDQVDPRSIVVLTYSNKAAGELSERIAARTRDQAAAMRIGTFHAFGLDLVRRYHGALGFEREPRLIDRAEAIDLMLDRMAGLNLTHYRDLLDPTDKLRDLLSAISRAQDEVVLAGDYAELVEAMAERDDGPEMAERVAKAREVANVYRSYTELKRQGERIDFGDLVALPADLLTRRPEIARQVRETISHVLVDEYQDVNRASVQLLRALTDDGRNLWCVGDVRQSIYRFRGASSFNLARFDKGDFDKAQRGQLDTNYRSREEIVTAYSAFAADMKLEGATAVDLIAHRGRSGHRPEFRHVQGVAEREIDGVADTIEELREAGFAYRDQALLCRGNDRLAELGRGLEARGIPVLYLGSVFERPEVKDLLAWLSLLIDRRAMGLARATGVEGMTLPLGDVAAIAASLGDDQSAPLAWLTAHPGGLTPDGTAKLARYQALLNGFDARSAPWETLARLLLDRSRIAATICDADDMASRARGIAIWQFMNFVRAQPIGGDAAIATLLDRIRRLVRLSDDRELRHIPQAASGIDAVRLMTMHGSKGLEFPVVHLTGITKGSFPHGGAGPACPPPDGMIRDVAAGADFAKREDSDEQQCLFYVALSRAKDRMILYSPSKNAADRARNPSVFVDRMGAAIAHSKLTPRDYGIDTREPPVAVSYSGVPTYRQQELSLYERCPRRFFYTYVLSLGGRRGTSPYEDLHDIVRGAMLELNRIESTIDDATLRTVLDIHWDRSRLSLQPASGAYRLLADELIACFAAAREGGVLGPGHSLSFDASGAAIQVDFHYAWTDDRGRTILRQVQTGHHRKTVMKGDMVMAPFFAVRRQTAGHGADMLHLSDGIEVALDLDADKAEATLRGIGGMVDAIAAGLFPTKASTRSCPKCPAFFTCGAVPTGTMQKKF